MPSKLLQVIVVESSWRGRAESTIERSSPPLILFSLFVYKSSKALMNTLEYIAFNCFGDPSKKVAYLLVAAID